MFIHMANRPHETKPLKQPLFIFIEARLRHLPPFAPHTLANFKSLTKLIIAPPLPFGVGGMFIHIANRPHKTKPFRQPLFIFIEARLRHLPPFEGSPRAGAAEYVLRGGDV